MSAGKNYAIAQILFIKALKSKLVITVATGSYEDLKDGAILDFKNIYADAGRSFDDDWHPQDKELHINQSVIQFRYLKDWKPDAGKSKRRDILYLNEITRFSYTVASHYISRTKGEIFIDFNPDRKTWAHTKLPELKEEDGTPSSSLIVVTYQDNELIPAGELAYILSKRGTEWYRVYGEGKIGVYSESQIYRYTTIDKVPEDAVQIPSGMDFGKSPACTALVELYLKDNRLYVVERLCENNLMPEKIFGATRLAIVDRLNALNIDKGHIIVADSAGKTEIMDLRRHGYNIRGVHKKKNGQADGIARVQSYDIYVVDGSPNVTDQMDNWLFKEDGNGKVIPEPSSHEPDTLVCIRYALTNKNKTAGITPEEAQRWRSKLPI